jgi:Tol biopolymer transport system component
MHRIEVDSKRDPELLAHQDEGRMNSDPNWSPDGSQIVFMSDQ